MFDLDDTIVEAGTYVSVRVLRALAAARDAGYVLSVASGRPLCMIDRKILDAGVFDYCVCSNGALAVRMEDGMPLVCRLMSSEDARSCMELLAGMPGMRPAWNAFFDGKAYFELRGASYMLTGRTGAVARARRSGAARTSGPAYVLWLVRRGVRFVWKMAFNPRMRHVLSLERHLRKATCGVEKLGCSIVDGNRCAEAARILEDDGRFEVMRMGATELEITAKGVTKGTGARVLMEALDIDRAQSVAFGDGGNDLPLADAVGRFVAMGNADDEVKAAADEVCPPVAEDGVAVYIEQLLRHG